MKQIRSSGLLLSFILFTINLYAQEKSVATILESQANELGNAFQKSDWDNYINHLSPPLVKSMGGASAMKKSVESSITTMNSKGIRINSIKFATPTEIYKSGHELQSTIDQNTEFVLADGRSAIATTTLLAFSVDQGKTWKFMDTNNKDIQTIRKVLPNLNPSIVIKQHPTPSFGK